MNNLNAIVTDPEGVVRLHIEDARLIHFDRDYFDIATNGGLFAVGDRNWNKVHLTHEDMAVVIGAFLSPIDRPSEMYIKVIGPTATHVSTEVDTYTAMELLLALRSSGD